MNQLLTNLTNAAKNPHVSVPVALGVLCEICAIWMPNWKTQFTETQKVLSALAVVGAAAAGPTPPTPPKQ